MSHTIALKLDDQEISRLRLAADRAGVTAEELARAVVVQSLSGPRDEQFDAALRHVLSKNKELYERLAR